MAETNVKLRIEGMTCDGCAASIEHALKREKGIRRVKVNWRAKEGEVVFDEAETTLDDILDSAIFRRHYGASAQKTAEVR